VGDALYIGALPIPFSLTTDPSGTAPQQRKTSTLMNNQNVFCGFCGSPFSPSFQGPPAVPCTSNAQCTTTPFTACKQRNSGAFTFGEAESIVEMGSQPGTCIDDGLARDSTLVSVFCVPPAFNATVDANGDLPAPGAVALKGQSQLLP
jgi:hypothetical protein